MCLPPIFAHSSALIVSASQKSFSCTCSGSSNNGKVGYRNEMLLAVAMKLSPVVDVITVDERNLSKCSRESDHLLTHETFQQWAVVQVAVRNARSVEEDVACLISGTFSNSRIMSEIFQMGDGHVLLVRQR